MTSKDEDRWFNFLKTLEPITEHLKALDVGIQHLNTRLATQEVKYQELERRLFVMETLVGNEVLSEPLVKDQLAELREYVKDLQEELGEAWDELRDQSSS